MKLPRHFPFCAALVLTVVSVSAADKVPVTVLIQPEIEKVNNDVVRQTDDKALGGEYVTHMTAYNPLFSAKLDVLEGDPVVVWARVRKLAIQLKALHGEEQKELDWNWAAPADWKWVRVGEYSRDKAGDGFLIIRGADAPEGAGLDAVILTSAGDFDPAALTDKQLEGLATE